MVAAKAVSAVNSAGRGCDQQNPAVVFFQNTVAACSSAVTDWILQVTWRDLILLREGKNLPEQRVMQVSRFDSPEKALSCPDGKLSVASFHPLQRLLWKLQELNQLLRGAQRLCNLLLPAKGGIRVHNSGGSGYHTGLFSINCGFDAMATVSTNEFRNGLKVMIDSDPCTIVENEIVKPGKGQAFNRVKLRALLTGRILERTFKSGESIERADVHEEEYQYSYTDGDLYYFMHPDTFEQIAADKTAMGETEKWLKGQEICLVTLWNGNPISITPPNFVELEITETDPGLRGDTSGGGGKPATLETGAVVRVPLFVSENELIRVDTRTGEYVSRVKE